MKKSLVAATREGSVGVGRGKVGWGGGRQSVTSTCRGDPEVRQDGEEEEPAAGCQRVSVEVGYKGSRRLIEP